jgi:hypothetical protein
MYVYYEINVLNKINSSDYDINNCYCPESLYFPNECLWMVPGSVDPLKD